MKIQIESRVMGDLALNQIIPVAVAYQSKLIVNANGLKDLGLDNSRVLETIKDINRHVDSLKANVTAMIEERKRINNMDDLRDQARAYCDDVKLKYFDNIRYACDKLELLVDDEVWPLVKYREMLFLR